MKNKRTPFQRILSLLCAGVMLFSITPVQSFAEDVGTNSQAVVSQAEAEPQPAAAPQPAAETQPSAEPQPSVAPQTTGETEPAGEPQPEEDPQPAADVPVTLVTLDQAALELTVGSEATLTATVEPADATDPTVTWGSDTPDVASVTDGTVQALKAGSATITATAGGQFAECQVTVKEASQKEIPDVQVTIAEATYGKPSQVTVRSNANGTIKINEQTQTVSKWWNTTFDLAPMDAGKHEISYTFEPDQSEQDRFDKATGAVIATVNPKPISVQSFTLASDTVEYDGTGVFSVGTVTLDQSNILNNDDVQANAAGFTAKASPVNAGPVSVSLAVQDENNVLTGADADNYELKSLENLAPVSGTISPKPISVTEVAFGSKEYDGKAEIPEELATMTFDGLVGGDEVKLAGASYRLMDSVAAGDGKAVEANFDKASLTGAAADNYTLTPVANPTLGTVNVTAKELTVQVAEDFVATKVSDGDTALTEDNKTDIQAALSLNGVVGQDDVALEVNFDNAAYASGSVFDDNSIQGLSFSLSGTDVANYSLDQAYEMAAQITANAAKDVDLSQLADGVAQIADGVTIAFQPGTNAEGKVPYWYSAVPALAAQETAQLLDENGNGYQFPDLKQGENTCDNMYALVNGVYYGPFRIAYQGDSVAPVIDVDNVESVQFGKPWNKELQYTFVITDADSGVDTTSLQYYVGKKDLDADQIQDWLSGNPEKIDENTYRFTVSTQENSLSNRLYIRVQDMAGNTEALYSYCTLVVENTPPKLTIDLGGVDISIPHKSYTITANALDESSNDEILYSGVHQIQYVLTTQGENGEETVLEKTISANDAPSKPGNLWEYQKLEGVLDLGKQTDYNGTYTLTVTATDFCGNTSAEQTFTLEYDNTSAEIEVEMADPYQENYFRADNCGVAVTFTDDNLWVTDGNGEIGDYTVTLTGTEKGGKKDAVLTKSLTGKQEGDDDTTGTIQFTAEEITAAFADGNVKISATATDTAGNASKEVNSSFELDTTAPVLTKVSATEGGKHYEADGKVYYNKAFTLTYVVDELNYNANEVSFEDNAQTETGDAVVTTDATEAGNITWTVSGDAEKVDNAVYKPSLTVKDKAGNALVAGSELETTGQNAAEVANGTASLKNAFVLDTVPPKLTNVQMTEGGKEYNEGIYYQGSFAVTFTLSETNYDASDDKCAVTSVVEGDAKPLEVAKETTPDGHTVTVTAPYADTEKTTYDISLAVTDKAGNKLSGKADNTTIVEGKATAKTCIMDNVNPVAKLSYTDLDATHFYTEQDGKELTAYYNGDITTTLQLTDKGSIDTNLVSFTRYKDGGEALAVELPAYDSEQVVETVEVGNTVEAGENHLADGVYTYTLYGTDKAGNPLNVLEKDVFGKTPENSGDGDATIRFAEGCGADNAYTTAVKAMDTVNPTVEITYTDLDATHFYQEEGSSLVNAYYNHDFTAAFSFTEQYGTAGKTFGMDGSKLHYVQGLTDASDKDLAQANGEAAAQVQYNVTGQAENAHYTFTAYGEDKAGNPLIVTEHDTTAPGATVTYEDGKTAAYESNYQKVLDTVAPIFSLALDDPKNTSVSVDGDRAYYNTDLQATFTVKDANLDDGKINTLTNSKLGFDFNYDEADVSWQSSSLQHNAAEPVLNIIQSTLTAADDGVHRFQIEGEDRAGNALVQAKDEAAKTGFRATLSQGEGKFWTNVKVHDTVAPKLNVAFSDSETFYQSLLANDGEGSYYMVSINKPYRSTSSVSGLLTKDDCSPAKVTYQVESTTKDQALTKDGYDHSALNMKMEGAQIFYLSKLEISDRAGNSSVMPGATSKIYMDVEVPETDDLVPNVSVVALTTDAVRGQAGTDLYKSDVTVRATVTDPGEGINASGLYQVYYKVLVNGEDWTDKVAVSSKGSMVQPGLLVYGTSGEGVSITPPANETISCQDVIDFTFNANTFNYNDVKVFVWAQDNAGNLLEESLGARYQFGIDITAPTIRVTYDNNDVQNEKYFKNDRTATIVITERNFDPNNTTISTQNEASIGGWSYEAGSMANGDDDTWTCQVTYSQDGDYTFDVSTTDLVGHKNGDVDYAGSAAPKEFTVDKTAPVIQIDFDNNDVRNGKYYNAVRTATVQILEHNFSTEGVTLTTTANIQEGSVTAPAAGGWSSGGDMNTAQVPFTADGNYTMDVAFVDLAGNEAEPKSVEEFVVDTTAPELEISGVEDRMAYNGDVAPVITYHDINYDPQSAGVTIQGYKNSDGTNLSGVHTEDAFGGSFVCDNIEPVKENDDVYTARGVVTDMAGNETEVSVMFSVNRFGSTYFFADDTQALLDNYYTNQPQALHVTEINVDGLASRRVTTSLNGDLKNLQEGTDYTVTESVPGWHQFDYTVNAANFETEGIYDVTFYSEDEAGNTSSNRAVKENDAQTSDLPVSFVVDMTAPVNVITGVDNNEQYVATERTIMVNYDDNIGLRDLTIYVNDQAVAEYTADQLQAAGGAVEYLAKAANQWQQLTVVSTDMAGNVSEQSMVRYLLTDNLFVQYFNNKPLFYGSLVAVAALVVLTVVFVNKKKNKQTTNA